MHTDTRFARTRSLRVNIFFRELIYQPNAKVIAAFREQYDRRHDLDCRLRAAAAANAVAAFGNATDRIPLASDAQRRLSRRMPAARLTNSANHR